MAIVSVKINAIEVDVGLRDWFAGQALPGLISRCFLSGTDLGGVSMMLALESYKVADALMSERAGNSDRNDPMENDADG